MSAALAIDVRGLTKRYDGCAVVDGVTLQVAAGRICGFLGPNGSGKTTTISMLCGLLTPDAGEGQCQTEDHAFLYLAASLLLGCAPDDIEPEDVVDGRQDKQVDFIHVEDDVDKGDGFLVVAFLRTVFVTMRLSCVNKPAKEGLDAALPWRQSYLRSTTGSFAAMDSTST